ncbi:MAG: DUF721 domain-containing protein [Betaproteobacteria bacterium]|nr:DUF721 domain-containing protein [Betaproteobacteria bacterium]
MSEKRVGLLIDTLPELQALNREIRQLVALQSILAKVLPDNLAPFVTVASMNAGELNLFADNGPVAAKLRQMTPRMLTSLRQRGYEITGIRLQVQVGIRDNPLPQKQISLSIEARNVIDSLTDRLDASPLKSALKRLSRQGS